MLASGGLPPPSTVPTPLTASLALTASAPPNFLKIASQSGEAIGAGGRPFRPGPPTNTRPSITFASESSEGVRAKKELSSLKKLFADSTLNRVSAAWEQVKPKSWQKAADSAQGDVVAIGFKQEEEIKKNRSYERASKKRTEEDVVEQEEEDVGSCSERLRRRARRFVSSREFEVFMCFLILTNTVYFGVEAEYAAQIQTTEMPAAFQDVSLAYTIAFAVELMLKIYGYGCREFFFAEEWWWNFLDFTLVLISLMEVGADILISHMAGGSVAGAENLGHMKLLRIVRTARILRVLRIVTFFRSLRILLMSVLHTMKSLFAAIILLLLILYIFGVLFTQATTQVLVDMGPEAAPELDKYYGSVISSIYTLFMCITGGVSWEIVNESLSLVNNIWCFLFVVYISFTYFAVLNVITGVFCQTAIESALRDQDELLHTMKRAKKSYIDQLTVLFNDVDADGNGEMTFDEFEELLKDERLEKYCASLDLLIDDAWELFKLLDSDGSGAIGVDEFVSGCLRLKGGARSVDLALNGYQLRWIIDRFEKFVAYTDGQFVELRASTEAGFDRIMKSCADYQRASHAAILVNTTRGTGGGGSSGGGASAAPGAGPDKAEGWSPKLWDDVPA